MIKKSSIYTTFCTLIFKAMIVFVITSTTACQDDNITSGSGPGFIPNPRPYDWTIQFAETTENLTDVFFINITTGWVVGENNTILSTVNGGLNWPQAPVSLPEGNFRGVHMVNSNEGWISGDMNGRNENGNLYLSTNGGAYPESQKLLLYPINTVFSVEEKYVWAAGDSGQLIYSKDAGMSWNETESMIGINITDLHFLNKNIGYASGVSGKILKTADGGIIWNNTYEFTGSDLMAIHYINIENGWACGSRNTLLKYEHVGDSSLWTNYRIENELAGITWNDIFFLSELKGWVVGDGGTVYRTDDGGATWIKESTGLFDDLYAIHMIDETSGWIAGENGLILTYTPKN